MKNHSKNRVFEGAKIVGLGSAMGSIRISNEALEERLGIKASEIESKTGIRNRFHCDPLRENLYVLMASSIEQAAHSAGMSVLEIDGIFSACNPTGEFLLPNTSTIVASLLGLKRFYSGNGGTGCCGGLSALDAAFNKLRSDSINGRARVYAVVAGDQTSEIIKEKGSDEMLFSDGSGCLIVTNKINAKGYYEIFSVDGITTPNGAESLRLLRLNGKLEHEGRKVFKFATGIIPAVKSLLTGNMGEAYIVPHQASRHILAAQSKKLEDSLFYTGGLSDIGNTSPASTFIGLEDVLRKGLNKREKTVLMAFGEGLSVYIAELKSLNREMEIPERLCGEQLNKKYMGIYQRKWAIHLETEG